MNNFMKILEQQAPSEVEFTRPNGDKKKSRMVGVVLTDAETSIVAEAYDEVADQLIAQPLQVGGWYSVQWKVFASKVKCKDGQERWFNRIRLTNILS